MEAIPPIQPRRNKPLLRRILAILLISLLLIVPVGVWVAFIHTRCELGSPLATRLLSTPMMMVNDPYGGNSSAYATFFPGPGPS